MIVAALPGEVEAKSGHRGATGGLIEQIVPGSQAEAAGLRPGDAIVSVNGHALRDALAFQYLSLDDRLRMSIVRDGEQLTVAMPGGTDLGIRFGDLTFDGIRRCVNRCPFCFVKQLPKGLRRSLYVKDDDYRYSVGYGSFVTLTNLDEQDWQRLAEQRLGPIRVSVHATEFELRRKILGNPHAPDVMEQLRRLRDLGIQAHAQLVLCPGLNDGEHMKRSIADLASLFPSIQSIAAVPVGLTNRSRQTGIRSFTRDEALATISYVRHWQRAFRKRFGVGLVYLADEFYSIADQKVPSGRQYDGYPQYENGVGLVRTLLDEWARLRHSTRIRAVSARPGSKLTVACGTGIAPVMKVIVEQMSEITGFRIKVIPVENTFFGSSVTVSGLLTGGDVIRTIAGQDLGDMVMLPRAMLDVAGDKCLDETTPGQLAWRLRRPVYFCRTLRDLLGALSSAHAGLATRGKL